MSGQSRLRRLVLCTLLPAAALYLAVAAFLINDYGQTWDDQENFGVGHKFLGFYLTGTLEFASPTPPLSPRHVPVYDSPFVRRAPFRQWAFANEVSALCCELFFDGPGGLDSAAAHHLAAPLFVALLIVGLGGFVAYYFNRFCACLTIGLLLSYPRFWGHGLSNIKDVPELALFSLTLFSFAHWMLGKRRRNGWLWLSGILFGLALATKPDALLIPPLLVLWLLPRAWALLGKTAWREVLRTIGLLTVGLLIAALVCAACFPPMWFPGRWTYLRWTVEYMREIAINDAIGWNLYAPKTIFWVTPVATLAVFVLGWMRGLAQVWKASNLRALLVIWALVPILRHSLPGSNHYDGLRHFLIFLVPTCILAADGLDWLSRCLKGRFRLPLPVTRALLCSLVLIPSITAIAQTHPYQTTFYNALVGGLQGAQERGLPDSCDYWCTSYRDAGRWLDRHAVHGARIAAGPQQTLIYSCIRRPDLARWNPALESPPPGSYLVIVPRYPGTARHLREGMRLVHRVERQGGEIYSIYFQP